MRVPDALRNSYVKPSSKNTINKTTIGSVFVILTTDPTLDVSQGAQTVPNMSLDCVKQSLCEKCETPVGHRVNLQQDDDRRVLSQI